MLRLRPFRSPDAATIITWTSEPEEFYKWTAGIMGDYPVSEKKLLEVVSAREDNTRYFPLVAFDENGLVGFFTVRTPGEDDRKVRFGYVIVDPKKRGQGYGKQMLNLGLKFVFDIYGADEVSLGVFDNNESAQKCYRSVGFKENGEREEYSIAGEKWIDIEMKMSRIERRIRKACETDINDLLELYHSLIGGKADWNMDYPSLDTIMFDLEHEALFLMEDEKGKVIAAISIDEDDEVEKLPCWTKQNAGELSRLAVSKEVQGQGIGRIMMQYAFQELKKRGKDSVHIIVRDGHNIALKSYEYFNYEQVGECDLFGKHFLCLERSL